MEKNKYSLKPLLKYPGGKGSELVSVFNYAPERINNYIEPFVGGGAVYFAVEAQHYFINDISEDLMLLYEYVRDGNEAFFNELTMIVENWERLGEIAEDSFQFFCETLSGYKEGTLNFDEINNAVNHHIDELEDLDRPLFRLDHIKQDLFKIQLVKNMVSMIKRISKNEKKKKQELSRSDIKDNFECSVKSAYYMYFRELYNTSVKYNNLETPRRVAMYFFIREYCYSSMFRFNKNGGFNVPYGGISYNKKSLNKKIQYFQSEELLTHLGNTTFCKEDFMGFLRNIDIGLEDFMFLDPPYDTVFSEYDQNTFGQNDQIRLAKYLINDCPCKFMLIIKKTAFIDNLYYDKGLTIREIDKTYFVSFQNRNEKAVTHLIITNY
jgi:DNA adenine methylase